MRYVLEVEKLGLAATGGYAATIEMPCEGGWLAIDVSQVPRNIMESARELVVDVYHELEHTLGFMLRFSEASGEGAPPGSIGSVASITATLGVLPGLLTRLTFPMSALDGQTVFLPRTPGRLKATVFGKAVSAVRMEKLEVGLSASGSPQSVHISNIVLTDEETAYPAPKAPIVDELGQWTQRDWTGKTASEAELKRELEQSLADAATSSYPEGWSRYGGWTSKPFEGTGFFRTQHDGRRWWLVDPDGYAFFSSGIDCMRPEAECFVRGNEELFEWLPDYDGEYAQAWNARGSFSFTTANLIRAWGSDWFENWRKMTKGRMAAWGFNTVANWSSSDFYRGLGVPYVWQPSGFPSTQRMIYRDFPDVFSREYLSGCTSFAEGLVPLRDDKYQIGYFLRNEPLWAFGENNIAEHLLESGEGLASLDKLLEFLSDRYSGDVKALAGAWGGTDGFASFSDLIGLRNAGSLSEASSRDLWDFTAVLVRQYLEPLCVACRRADSNHLNLGMRYAWLSSDACLAGSDLFDVFSINMYQMKPSLEVIKQASEVSGLPVMIGEYHWGALDRGLPSTGLRAVKNQTGRGVAYEWYLEQAAAMPWLVGTHYFQLYDQPIVGRFDGENFEIGFVDICHKVYSELSLAARRAHERMYMVADGVLEPTQVEPEEVPRQGF